MNQIVDISGTATLTNFGKQVIAASMYAKGKAFIGASILLRQQAQSEPTEYVSLHLLCQGIEITLKGLLLHNDYDTYRPKLQKRLGHNLLKIADRTAREFGLKPMRAPLRSEVEGLHSLYSNHHLRYGGGSDIFLNPATIVSDRSFRRITAVIRLVERHRARNPR